MVFDYIEHIFYFEISSVLNTQESDRRHVDFGGEKCFKKDAFSPH